MLEQALKFSELHHTGQVDKAGVDYLTGHILSVVANAKKMGYANKGLETGFESLYDRI